MSDITLSGPGFYKAQEEILLHGPNFVLNKDYELRKEHKDEYQYPVDGWYWFESEEEARAFLNLPLPQPEPDPQPEPIPDDPYSDPAYLEFLAFKASRGL